VFARHCALNSDMIRIEDAAIASIHGSFSNMRRANDHAEFARNWAPNSDIGGSAADDIDVSRGSWANEHGENAQERFIKRRSSTISVICGREADAIEYRRGSLELDSTEKDHAVIAKRCGSNSARLARDADASADRKGGSCNWRRALAHAMLVRYRGSVSLSRRIDEDEIDDKSGSCEYRK